MDRLEEPAELPQEGPEPGEVDGILKQLSRLIGFRVVPGVGERVIYRELFPKGLTAMDLEADEQERMSLSHVAAAREVRSLVKAIKAGNLSVPR